METNKGMNIHDDLNSQNEHISNILMSQFLKHYKSPYLVTDVYKKFILEGKVLYENISNRNGICWIIKCYHYIYKT